MKPLYPISLISLLAAALCYAPPLINLGVRTVIKIPLSWFGKR